MFDRIGLQLGNYRLVRSLGSGGFADVYLAEHIYLNTQAAIKILQTRLAQNDLQIFLAEARTIANLTHRNIVQVLEFGIEKDTPFLVMTYAPNGTLRQRYPNGSRLSPAMVVSYINQVAAALQYAHDRKVIHRDVKPENMLVGQSGDVLLSDFGIAVVAQSSRYGGQEVGGTVTYMAPEQLQGRASPASDQYALAVVAYEWLTGELPFKGSFAEIGGQHIYAQPPSLREKAPSLSGPIEQVIQTALNKNPQQRFQSVQAFASALAQASGVSQGAAAPLDDPLQAGESQIATFVKQSSGSAYPPLGNNSAGNYPVYSTSQQGDALLPPPPAGFTMQNGGNINTPRFQNSAPGSGQFSQPVPPVAPGQEKRRAGHRGLIFAVIALVVILIVVTSAGATYFLTHQQAPSTGTGNQTQQATTTLPQTGASTPSNGAPTATLVPQATDTAAPTVVATPTVAATAIWGTGTKNQQLICISNCDASSNNFAVTLINIAIDTTRSAMVWNFSVTDRGDICTYLSGRIELVDPAGTHISANGGTFTETSSINSGQTLPKTATFSTLPTPGVLYEVQISAGCYGNSTFQPVNFQR